VHNATEKIQL